MKEYKHLYVEEARRILEARVDRSKWNKAVTEDAIDLLIRPSRAAATPLR